jgi:predicted helicase
MSVSFVLLHHPGYRTKFADNLKRELPRIPFAPDFKAFADAGKQLAELHLNYEQLKPWPLKFIEAENVPLSYVVAGKMKLNRDKTTLQVNDSLILEGIPPEVYNYRLGNRSALEWVIDQYRITEDARSTPGAYATGLACIARMIHIVRLVGQVVRVSVDTVQIVAGLPAAYA